MGREKSTHTHTNTMGKKWGVNGEIDREEEEGKGRHMKIPDSRG